MAIGVFEFGFGEGRAGARAPVHWFQAPVDVAGQHHLAKHADLGGFVVLVEGEVGLLPVGPDAPALEALLLALHLFEGVGVGFLAQADRGEGLPFAAAQPLEHLQLNRQAVAVPTWDKARFFALQQGGFVDDVLEDFVERMAHVQGPIGVGGAVVEGEALAGIVLAESLVELGFGPKSLELRLTHLGVGPHVERRLQQVQRVLVVGRSGGGACGHVA